MFIIIIHLSMFIHIIHLSMFLHIIYISMLIHIIHMSMLIHITHMSMFTHIIHMSMLIHIIHMSMFIHIIRMSMLRLLNLCPFLSLTEGTQITDVSRYPSMVSIKYCLLSISFYHFCLFNGLFLFIILLSKPWRLVQELSKRKFIESRVITVE